jgi:phosphoribosylformimino-5-aminoimidazole carboxamide ribotide isomerase
MILYPTIALPNGRCVSLTRGRPDGPAIWHVDPLARAQESATQGATARYVTDFDAMFGARVNRARLVRGIAAAGIPVQVGGGFRPGVRFGACLALRTDRVVVGTPAAQNPHRVRELAEKHPGRNARTVDVRHDRVMVEGWKVQSSHTARAFIESLRDTPFGALIVSHIGAIPPGMTARPASSPRAPARPACR